MNSLVKAVGIDEERFNKFFDMMYAKISKEEFLRWDEVYNYLMRSLDNDELKQFVVYLATTGFKNAYDKSILYKIMKGDADENTKEVH